VSVAKLEKATMQTRYAKRMPLSRVHWSRTHCLVHLRSFLALVAAAQRGPSAGKLEAVV